MENKPVAWMVGKQVCRLKEQAELQSHFHGDPVVPLYTQPSNQDIDSLITQIKYLESQVYGGTTK